MTKEQGPYLTVVIPVFDEEKRIGKTLISVDEYLLQRDYGYEMIVVNDGSRDRTTEVVRQIMGRVRNLRLIDNKTNHGKGWAVRQGLLEGRGEFRLFMDADHSTTIDHVEKAWGHLEKGYEVVIGTRDRRDHSEARQAVPQPFVKKFLGDLGNLLIQGMAVRGIWDTQCGFKVFSARAAQDIFSRTVIDRWGFDIEVLALAKPLGYKIALIPTVWINDPRSKVDLRGYFRTLSELVQIKYNLVTDKYGLKAGR